MVPRFEAAHEVRIAELLSKRDYAGAADLQARQLRAKDKDGEAGASTASSEPDDPDGHSETEGESSDGEKTLEPGRATESLDTSHCPQSSASLSSLPHHADDGDDDVRANLMPTD